MSVATVVGYPLPDSAYEMWVRGELAEHFHLPDGGTRVEVVGGEIVVSPSPGPPHNFIVDDIVGGVHVARSADRDFPLGLSADQ